MCCKQVDAALSWEPHPFSLHPPGGPLTILFRPALFCLPRILLSTPLRGSNMSSRMNRRRFLQVSAVAAGAGFFHTTTAVSAARAAAGPNGKLHFAGIGVGGKGRAISGKRANSAMLSPCAISMKTT